MHSLPRSKKYVKGGEKMGFDTEKHNKAIDEAMVAIGFTSKIFKLKTIVEKNSTTEVKQLQ